MSNLSDSQCDVIGSRLSICGDHCSNIEFCCFLIVGMFLPQKLESKAECKLPEPVSTAELSVNLRLAAGSLKKEEIERYGRQMIIPEIGLPGQCVVLMLCFTMGPHLIVNPLLGSANTQFRCSPSRSVEASEHISADRWLWRPGLPVSDLLGCSWNR